MVKVISGLEGRAVHPQIIGGMFGLEIQAPGPTRWGMKGCNETVKQCDEGLPQITGTHSTRANPIRSWRISHGGSNF